MKKLVLPVLLWALSFPLVAQAAGTWVGYVTYLPKPVVTSVAFDPTGLKWLADTASRLGRDGFTFLGRRDGAHWLAFTTSGGSWVLQVHDETAKFNFRGVVSSKTGRLTVEKGVSWEGLGRQADAVKSATMALGYAEKARIAKDLFSMEPAMAPKPTISPPAMTKPKEMATSKTMMPPPTSKVAPSAKTAPAAPMTPSPAMLPMTDTAMAPSMEKASASMAPVSPASMMGPSSPADDPWRKLIDGNLRFVSGKVTHPDQSMVRVSETAQGQKPFAIVVSCSDSPVPPEVIFDQGIGDLYVIRTAGEVVTDVELGSIEYAVQTLGVPYLVVMGERNCGIVDMTLKGGDLPHNIDAVAAQIRPSVEVARFLRGDLLDNAVRENAKNMLAKIKATPALSEAIKDGKLNVKAAYDDTATGKVSELP